MNGPSDTFERLSEPILAALMAGASISDAARRHGCSPRTVKACLERGRRSPNGPYGDFADRVDSRRRERVVSRKRVPDHDEILLLLSTAARAGSVPAMKELLRHHERQDRGRTRLGPLDGFDELAARRDR